VQESVPQHGVSFRSSKANFLMYPDTCYPYVPVVTPQRLWRTKLLTGFHMTEMLAISCIGFDILSRLGFGKLAEQEEKSERMIVSMSPFPEREVCENCSNSGAQASKARVDAKHFQDALKAKPIVRGERKEALGSQTAEGLPWIDRPPTLHFATVHLCLSMLSIHFFFAFFLVLPSART
jgi:hypothetical protein